MAFGDAWMVCKGCLGMYQYQIHLRKVILGHILPLLQTHSCPLMRKSTFVWRCVGVSGDDLVLSGGVWLVCWGVWGCISTKSICKRLCLFRYCLSSKALFYEKLPLSEGVWMVSGWCLGVSGGSHSDSGCCQLGIYAKTSNTSSISVTVLSYCIFFQWPS